MLTLFEHTEKRMVERLKMEGALHGVKFDEDEAVSKPKSASGGVIGDPDSYSHLTMEERNELTRKMMGKHKMWVENDKPMGGKEPIDKR